MNDDKAVALTVVVLFIVIFVSYIVLENVKKVNSQPNPVQQAINSKLFYQDVFSQ